MPVALGFGISTPEQARAGGSGGRRRRDRGHAARAGGRRVGGSRRGGWRARGRTGGAAWRRPTDRRPARIPRGMGFILTVTAGLIVWIVLVGAWSEGLRRVHARHSDHPGRRIAEDSLRLPPGPSQLARPVRARWLCLAALAATATVLAGCGGVGVSGATEATGNQLAVYSSLPLQGPVGRRLGRNRRRRATGARAGGRPRRSVQGRLRLAR